MSMEGATSDAVVLHRSEHYLIVDKGYDILVNSDNPEDVTVHQQLRRQFPDLANKNLKHEFHFAHRLDFSTSGVLCVALTKTAAKEAMSSFSSRRVRKYYLALLHGHVTSSELITISVNVGTDSRAGHRHRMCTVHEAACEHPKSAVTKLLVLQLGMYDAKPATKVIFQPVTGRRHQIRLHSRHIGHTIVGDYTYSDKADVAPYRMFLHAFQLVMPTPSEAINVKTADPFLESDERNKWTVTTTLRELNDELYSCFE